MAWEVWWALVFGFTLSAVVQAWVPRQRIESLLSGSGVRSVGVATGLGAASSSCSYAAVAIARSLLEKGASTAAALAFQFASTNLVWELGLVLWVLIGWQFTVAEYLGGIIMIILMAVMLRAFVSRRSEQFAREHVSQIQTDHAHCSGKSLEVGSQPRFLSRAALSEVANNFFHDWKMLWKEIVVGFLLAGFVAQLDNGFFASLFIKNAPHPLPLIENAIIGPIVAIATFVCSVGNVPLAAVLWSGGISFGGVMAFIFADLIVLPIIAIYRKYYGTNFALRITALMFVSMVIAAIIIDGIFSALGLIPTGPRPSRHNIFGTVTANYKLYLNIVGACVFALFIWLRPQRLGNRQVG